MLTQKRRRMAVNAVSQGAILRALDKKNGPARFAKSSYGLLRSEPWGDHIEHSGQNYSVNRTTGDHFIMHTIYWVVKKVRPFLDSSRIRILIQHVLGRQDRAKLGQ